MQNEDMGSTVAAVVDTNVLISGLISAGGPPRQIVDAGLQGHYELVTSLYLVQELAHVLSTPRIRKRLGLRDDEVQAILAGILAKAKVVAGRLKLPGITRDPKDDAVVACAIEGQAAYVVSGDDDLLSLQEVQGVQIVTPKHFVEILQDTG
jgi:putative PIN family toxin of toxin-antitoxin system